MKALFVSFLMLAACLAAAAPPDFSGTYQFNAAKSNAPGFPEGLSFTFKHKDPELLMTQLMPGQEPLPFKLGTDGKEYRNTLPNGVEMVTKMKWDGETLVAESTIGEAKLYDRLTRSADGKTLNMVRKISAPNGDNTLELVFDRQ